MTEGSEFNVGALREARGPNPGRGPSWLYSSARAWPELAVPSSAFPFPPKWKSRK